MWLLHYDRQEINCMIVVVYLFFVKIKTVFVVVIIILSMFCAWLSIFHFLLKNLILFLMTWGPWYICAYLTGDRMELLFWKYTYCVTLCSLNRLLINIRYLINRQKSLIVNILLHYKGNVQFSLRIVLHKWRWALIV